MPGGSRSLSAESASGAATGAPSRKEGSPSRLRSVASRVGSSSVGGARVRFPPAVDGL